MQGRISAKEVAEELYWKLPKFPDGRIDFHGSDKAPVVTAYLFRQGRLLLLKRSSAVGHYKLMWDVVSGYLDEIKDPVEKALEEIDEELGIGFDAITSAFKGEEFSIRDDGSRIEWIIAPVSVSLKGSFEIKLNFENTEYIWIDPAAISNYKTVPGLEIGLRNVMQA
jgi:isopentenyldiphosphate isomerase